MSAEFYDGGIPPRIWASKFQGLHLDEWPEMLALVPHSLKGLVKTHLRITMERKGVPEKRRDYILNTVLAVAPQPEPVVQEALNEERGQGLDDDGQGEGLQDGSGLSGEDGDAPEGREDDGQASVVVDDVASAGQEKAGRVEPPEDSGGQFQQDSLFG